MSAKEISVWEEGFEEEDALEEESASPPIPSIVIVDKFSPDIEHVQVLISP